MIESAVMKSSSDTSAAVMKSRSGLTSAILLALALIGIQADAADRHEGVASCAGGTCHASTHAMGTSGIRRDEYFIWQQRDTHARATATLSNERSRRMGRALGIEPASAAQCLSCHAENVRVELRGERWLASDGIGCEACHGGSERWLAPHTKPGLSAAEKTELGMTPTWQPQARAALCLTCHQGDAAHPITHAMMAAGHPALLFELDTFTALQPPHHDRDADYVQRKGVQDAARDWAVGQAMAADSLLRSIETGQLGQGLFPELVYFDCDACHHDMSAGRWLPARNAATVPGTPSLADASLYWLGQWLDVAAPKTASLWHTRTIALQTATQTGLLPLRDAALEMRHLLQKQVLPLVQAQVLDTAQLNKLLRAIAATAASPQANNFMVAQQAAMAAIVVDDSLRQRDVQTSAAQRKAIDALFTAVRQREAFTPRDYQAALQRLGAADKP